MEAERGTVGGRQQHDDDRDDDDGRGHDHGHDRPHGKDPAEQEALARDLGEELTDIFARYVRGDVDFADLTFLTFETLQDLHVIASGEYEVEYEDDEEDEASPAAAAPATDGEGYDRAEATEQQEELAQERAG